MLLFVLKEIGGFAGALGIKLRRIEHDNSDGSYTIVNLKSRAHSAPLLSFTPMRL